MAENYSLGSRFGLNVSSQKAKLKQPQTKEISLGESLSNLFDLENGYIAKYENVFNGNVEKEINMYSRQAMIVGMNLNADKQKSNFDVNI